MAGAEPIAARSLPATGLARGRQPRGAAQRGCWALALAGLGCGYFDPLTRTLALGSAADAAVTLPMAILDTATDDREATADGAGDVWIASGSGVRCVFPDGGRLAVTRAANGLTDDSVRTAAGGLAGQALVGFGPQGLPGRSDNPPQLNYLTLDPGAAGGVRLEAYSFNLTNEIVQANHASYDPARNQFWIGTNEGLSLFTAARDVLEHRHPVHPHGFTNGVAIDPGGAVWDGDQFQLSRLNAGPSGANFAATFDPVLKPFPLSEQNLAALALDDRGRVWAASLTQGLVRVDTQALTAELWTAAAGLPSLAVTSVAVDPDGSVWAGTFDSGLARLDVASASWSRFAVPGGAPALEVRFLSIDPGQAQNPRRLIVTSGAGIAAYTGP